MSGRFITLEGGEGVGKSTQLRRLAEALGARGLEVVVTREPGGSPGAEAIRRLLLEGAEDRWSPRAEALLFAAARADHGERTIRPAIARGAWVLSDRYLDSSRAYQGSASGLDDAEIMGLHRIGSRGLLPDRTLVLTLDEEVAAARCRDRDGVRGDRIGGREPGYHAAVAAAFRRMAQAEPGRFRLVDAAGSPEEVTHRLLQAVEGLAP